MKYHVTIIIVTSLVVFLFKNILNNNVGQARKSTGAVPDGETFSQLLWNISWLSNQDYYDTYKHAKWFYVKSNTILPVFVKLLIKQNWQPFICYMVTL